MDTVKPPDLRADEMSFPMTEEDTQECAAFLLTLKHRSVTPEPLDHEDASTNYHSTTYAPPATFEPISFSNRHVYDSDDSATSNDKTPPSLSEEPEDDTNDEMRKFESLLDGSKLVLPEDRELVPDPVFVAMAQMKVCHLTESDRVGCYRDRDVGFVGMCCKHCGGQPGYGRYFPGTLRSLAQTTTSQTILKHVSQKCRFCPPHLRKAILDLQRQHASSESGHNNKSRQAGARPRYGSRKVFFQRIWGRLHDEPSVVPERPLVSIVEDDSTTTEEENVVKVLIKVDNTRQRKHRFGQLPAQKNGIKRKQLSSGRVPFKKRARHTFELND